MSAINFSEMSTLEDLWSMSTLEHLWPQKNYNYKSADNKLITIIPPIIIPIIIPGCEKEDCSCMRWTVSPEVHIQLIYMDD